MFKLLIASVLLLVSFSVSAECVVHDFTYRHDGKRPIPEQYPVIMTTDTIVDPPVIDPQVIEPPVVEPPVIDPTAEDTFTTFLKAFSVFLNEYLIDNK